MTVTVERPASRVALITLNRPQALNALNLETMRELTTAAAELDRSAEVGAIVLTGSDRAFAAGADIKEMASRTFSEMHAEDWFAGWDALTRVRTPLIAAVAGHALGGGCELAMMCDLLLAAESARFGQPEITLGVIPGMGGSQRLTRAIGKAKAMDLILTGRTMRADEAERCGLVSRVVPNEQLRAEAIEVAAKIASMSLVAARTAKEAVNRSFESSLAEGVLFERRVFHALFATEDQKEGMAAFTEKRKPDFRHC
ncbi:enoyl-CoA hydratase [Amycolatopsis sulphurea]|uniref:Probable enoyl-CoA hydratase echA8 n=1 Tax=Amycolatopsis sulphurea TaxID=76022 RepID=A0A2A9FIJ5_9PSEU|nr:enoyl-CoA hydratase [Amycolatopsis sulphurea]PFG50968.1 enoyl-CoA hydratase [Amycolatopsis sulphurea]